MIKASSPLEKKKKKTPFLPANKKNFTKYKPKKIKGAKSLTASSLWKFVSDVK